MQQQSVQFILMIAVLGIVLIAITGFAPTGDLAGNFTKTKITVTPLQTAGDFYPTQAGEFWNYDIKISSTLEIDPAPEEDITVIAIIDFKGRAVQLSGFNVNKNEEQIDIPNMEVDILSAYPPLSKAFPGLNTFSYRQEYFINTPGLDSTFKIGMANIEKTGDPSVCRVQFFAECKTEKQYTQSMIACETGSNSDCSRSVNLCGGTVDITLRSADCSERKSTAEIETSGGTKWDLKEEAVVSYYRKSQCTDINDVEFWKECRDDFLGSERIGLDRRNSP